MSPSFFILRNLMQQLLFLHYKKTFSISLIHLLQKNFREFFLKTLK